MALRLFPASATCLLALTLCVPALAGDDIAVPMPDAEPPAYDTGWNLETDSQPEMDEAEPGFIGGKNTGMGSPSASQGGLGAPRGGKNPGWDTQPGMGPGMEDDYPGFDTGPNLETDSQPEMDMVDILPTNPEFGDEPYPFDPPPGFDEPMMPEPMPGMGHFEDPQEAVFLETVNLFDEKGWDRLWPLHHAAVMGDFAAIKQLCDRGCSPNRPMEDYHRATPLGLAASLGQTDAVKMLLRYGADPMGPASEFGDTPAENALREGHPDTAAYLEGYVDGRNNAHR